MWLITGDQRRFSTSAKASGGAQEKEAVASRLGRPHVHSLISAQGSFELVVYWMIWQFAHEGFCILPLVSRAIHGKVTRDLRGLTIFLGQPAT
jgi:hypothetical protein